MKNSLIIFIIIIIIGAVSLFVFVSFNQKNSSENGKNSESIPNFSLNDYNGRTINKDDFLGKVLIINSWASWCPFCVNELQDFIKLQEEFKNDIQIVAINRRESLETAKGFTDTLGVRNVIIYLLDPKDNFYQGIGGFSMPETIFVNKNGKIIFHKRGFMPFEEMKSKTIKTLDNNNN